ncbi:hypothetical protein [Actinomadura kijaniata]|uniref:hypothetical protein n=1 Tax=Actinomadura kijaniata TaxID=46161 RepID=UPI00082F58E2|nr:hypothetical protein [Actinomadura kijaniata]
MSGLTVTERLLEKALLELREASGAEDLEWRRGDVHVEHEDIEAEVAALSEAAGTVLDPRFKEGLCRFDEISACWSLDSPRELGGEFSVVNLHQALAEKAHGHPLEETLTPDERQRWSELRPFDGHPVTGTGEWVALRVSPDEPMPELWYYHPEIAPYKGLRMDIDYCGYLRNLAITKGVYGWQKLFCDITSLDEDDREYFRADMAEMLELFPVLFPDHDYEPLRRRLAERS